MLLVIIVAFFLYTVTLVWVTTSVAEIRARTWGVIVAAVRRFFAAVSRGAWAIIGAEAVLLVLLAGVLGFGWSSGVVFSTDTSARRPVEVTAMPAPPPAKLPMTTQLLTVNEA